MDKLKADAARENEEARVAEEKAKKEREEADAAKKVLDKEAAEADAAEAVAAKEEAEALAVEKLAAEMDQADEVAANSFYKEDAEAETAQDAAGTLVTMSPTARCRSRDWELVVSTFDSSETCQVVIINNLGRPFIFCWVDGTGKLYHYYPIQDNSIRDGSVSNSHTEYAYVHHTFVGMLQPLDDSQPTTLSEIDDQVRRVM